MIVINSSFIYIFSLQRSTLMKNQQVNSKPLLLFSELKQEKEHEGHSEVSDSKKKRKQNMWSKYIQDQSDFDLFDPTRIEDIDLKRNKSRKVVFMEPSRSEKKLQSLKSQGKIFHDEQFPPNNSSLFGQYPPEPRWEGITWQPLLQYYPHGKIFLKKTVSPRDIQQGALGDCYFLAGLAALAQSPSRINQLFLIEERNEQKYFSVKILKQGKWNKIDLDEMIPFVLKRPAFSASVDGGLWVILLEKAWAKIYGSYRQIEAGFAQEVLHDLTGAPVKNINFKSKRFNKQESWKVLDEDTDKNYAMVCCSNPGRDTDKSSSGIVQGHAYTFLNATQIKYKEGVERIVKIRNPWGAVEFTGKWSDFDPIWNEVSQEQKKRVEFEPEEDDGTFFMDYDDFLSEFNYIEIAEINDHASYIYESYRDEDMKGVFFTIRIVYEEDYSLQIDMTPERSFPEYRQEYYKYPKGTITLKKINSDNTTEVILDEVSRSKKRTICHKVHLQPGKYVAFVKIDWNTEYEKDYIVNLASYSPCLCGIYISSVEDAIEFTGDKRTMWLGQFYKYIFKSRLNNRIMEAQNKHNQKQEEKNNIEFQKREFLPFLNEIIAENNKKKEIEQQEKKKKQLEEEKKKRQLEQQQRKRKEFQRQKQRLAQEERRKRKQMQEEILRREQQRREEEEKKKREQEMKKKKDVDTQKIKKKDPNNGKKMLMTKQKITTSQTSYSYKKDPFSKKIVTLSNKIEDHFERVTKQYKHREHLNFKTTETNNKKETRVIKQDGEQVQSSTKNWTETLKQKTDKNGVAKSKRTEKENTEQIMYESDNESGDELEDDSQLLRRLENIKSENDLSEYTREMEEEQKKSLINQAQNTDITSPAKNSAQRSPEVPEFDKKQSDLIQSFLKKNEANNKMKDMLDGVHNFQERAINGLMERNKNSSDFKERNVIRHPEPDSDSD